MILKKQTITVRPVLITKHFASLSIILSLTCMYVLMKRIRLKTGVEIGDGVKNIHWSFYFVAEKKLNLGVYRFFFF